MGALFSNDSRKDAHVEPLKGMFRSLQESEAVQRDEIVMGDESWFRSLYLWCNLFA
jgi:hypothetical protein